jgi:hypothetical protein
MNKVLCFRRPVSSRATCALVLQRCKAVSPRMVSDLWQTLPGSHPAAATTEQQEKAAAAAIEPEQVMRALITRRG